MADRCVTRLPPNNLKPSTFYVCLVTIFTLYHICCSRNQPFTLLFSCRLFFFSHLRDMLLLYVWCCLESHLFYPHPLLLLLFDAFHFCLSLLHSTYIMTGALTLIVAVVLVLVFSCFPIWTLAFFSPLSLAFFLSLCICFILYLSHLLLYSTCSVVEFVVRSFYLLYFTFCVGQ